MNPGPSVSLWGFPKVLSVLVYVVQEGSEEAPHFDHSSASEGELLGRGRQATCLSILRIDRSFCFLVLSSVKPQVASGPNQAKFHHDGGQGAEMSLA